MHRRHEHRKLLTTKMDSAHISQLATANRTLASCRRTSQFMLWTQNHLKKIKTMKIFYFIFSGLSLFTLVIVCVAEPNVERESGRLSLETTESREGVSLETTETREGKGKF